MCVNCLFSLFYIRASNICYVQRLNEAWLLCYLQQLCCAILWVMLVVLKRLFVAAWVRREITYCTSYSICFLDTQCSLYSSENFCRSCKHFHGHHITCVYFALLDVWSQRRQFDPLPSSSVCLVLLLLRVHHNHTEGRGIYNFIITHVLPKLSVYVFLCLSLIE